MDITFWVYGVFTLSLCYFLYIAYRRLQLSFAKHRTLSGHSKQSRRLSKLIKFFEYTQEQMLSIDGAPNDVIELRRKALENLDDKLHSQNEKSIEHHKDVEPSVSDLQFTSHYRVPFPYRNSLSNSFKTNSILSETKGVKVKDIDGNWRYDVSGSYGVNVFGYDFYKSCIESGSKKVAALGPFLGNYHPIIKQNIELIKEVSGQDEVSFHMSGTETVMQAIRLARYHTNKSHVVRFCGAYHGWWDGVQPGIGNKRKVDDVYTLSFFSKHTLKVLNTRNDIACILINPLQAFHPNLDSASDTALIASDRACNFNKSAYQNYLKKIRKICSQRNIVLIFDEVFTGFRLAYGGAQEYFNIKADMVAYGKTLGGGLPVGVLTGKSHLMKRFDKKKPLDVILARGTFNSHPYVLGAMNEFLHRIKTPEIQQIYSEAESVWNKRVEQFNSRLQQENLPLHVDNMQSILSISYLQPSAFNWLLQFYMKHEGLELSWLGTGRWIMSFNYTDDEFSEVIEISIKAAKKMQRDGWWRNTPHLTNKAIKRRFLKDTLSVSFPIMFKLIGPFFCRS